VVSNLTYPLWLLNNVSFVPNPIIREAKLTVKGTETEMRIKITEKGERVIMDPAVAISRVYLYFYLMINIGSLVGSIGMVYAEKNAGVWLDFLLPTLMLCKYTVFWLN
jgi:hypothetical protein